MNRIDLKLKTLKEKNKKALVPFITAGYPNKEETLKIIKILCDEGADIIELGIPYSDPLADGEIIEFSYLEAIKNNIKMKDILEIVKETRKFTEIPIVIMTYFNVVYCYGVKRFTEEFREVGIDGIIIPDLPLEEREKLGNIFEDFGVDLIPLVAPTSEERIGKIVKKSSGFIYCVSVNGITGERANLSDNLERYISVVKEKSNLPALIGFGVSNVETVRKLRNIGDGVIIGSAIVKRIINNKNGYNELRHFISSIRSELDNR